MYLIGHHRRQSSCSSMGSYICDSPAPAVSLSSGYAVPPDPPSTPVTCPHMKILGRTSPEIWELCRTPTFALHKSDTSCSATATSDPWTWSLTTIAPKAELLTVDHDSLSQVSLEDLSQSLSSLEIQMTLHSEHTGESNENHCIFNMWPTVTQKPKQNVTKKHSPTKISLHRRQSFDKLPSPPDLSQLGRVMPRKHTHRRNTTQIIRLSR